jgi:cell division protein FtsQ
MKKLIDQFSSFGLTRGAAVLKGLALMLLVFVLWSFAGKRQRSKVVNHIDIQIENEAENHFVDVEEIEDAISKGKNNMVFMRWYDSVSLAKLEQKIQKIDFVKKAQVSHDLAGNLKVYVSLVKPIARLISGGSDLDRYIGSEGELLPTSEKYASKVITIDGPGSRKMAYNGFQKDSTCQRILSLINYINEDPFWKAQLTHIYISEKSEFTFYPQVGNQEIEFGPATDFRQKFEKLQAFYHKIIPAKGWNTYRKVSVKFKNQIVCQKTSQN